MAGHNKWSQIKRKKAANDQKRAAQWGKLIREITVAARDGGGDPDMNPRLRLAIDTARSANMPNDNIDRAIKKGTGELEGAHYEETTYEAYGPGGVAIYVEALTDNNNRTVADLRHALGKHGGNLGQDGSVAWIFSQKGQIVFDAARNDETALLEAALEAGAEDMESDEDSFTVYTEASNFHAVQDALRESGLQWESAELTMIPNNLVPVGGSEAEKLLKLLEVLDDHDDVQKVHVNADIDAGSLVNA